VLRVFSSTSAWQSSKRLRVNRPRGKSLQEPPHSIWYLSRLGRPRRPPPLQRPHCLHGHNASGNRDEVLRGEDRRGNRGQSRSSKQVCMVESTPIPCIYLEA